jgi:hypothetical protein
MPDCGGGDIRPPDEGHWALGNLICYADDRSVDAVRGDVMETFTIGLGSRWWVRVFDRSPLVRRSDRVEAVVLIFAVVLTVVAVPIAGAIGTFVHDARTRVYAEEAQTRHQVIATATDDGTVVPQLRGVAFAAPAAWTESGIAHRAAVAWSVRAKVGDQQHIWVNGAGELVGLPSSPSRADRESVVVALAVWLAVAEGSVALVYLVRRRLNQRRHAEWDREVSAFHDNNGRRNHQS